jgi:hypothetical protein
MVEPPIRWLTASGKGYDIASFGLKLASKWHADDGNLLTNSVEDMISLLNIILQFSTWSGIHLNAAKCKIPAYIQELQAIPPKRDRDEALRARLAHVTLAGRPIGAHTQDEPLPGGYLATSLTASLSLKVHLLWTNFQIGQIGRAIERTPLPLHIKERLLLYNANSKISHTHCLMALSPQDIRDVDSLLEGISRQIWNLPLAFPKAGLHALIKDLGLNIPSIWEDCCGAEIRS